MSSAPTGTDRNRVRRTRVVASIVGFTALLALLITAAVTACGGTPILGSQQGHRPEQPIAFSHAIHAGLNETDCKYCHFGAERSRHAGVPPESVCMNCHREVKKDAPDIVKLTAAYNANEPIAWNRVHRLPDFVWFSHQNHVAAGLECQTCHGPVQQMVRVEQQETMTMGWCVQCHRDTVAEGAQHDGRALTPPTDCSACHR